jgi:hypothetical protein
MDRDSRDLADRVKAVLDEVGGVEVPHGPYFDELVDLITEELDVKLAVKLFNSGPDTDAVRSIAEGIAAEIDYMFSLSPRPQDWPGAIKVDADDSVDRPPT